MPCSVAVQTAGLIFLGLVAWAALIIFMWWLVRVPHREIQSDFQTVTERNLR